MFLTIVNFLTGFLAGVLVFFLLSFLGYLAVQAVKDFNKPFHFDTDWSDHVDDPHTPDTA